MVRHVHDDTQSQRPVAGHDTSPARLTATHWPDCDELLLILQWTSDLAVLTSAGFRSIRDDHLQIPLSAGAVVRRHEHLLTLIVNGRELASTTTSDPWWDRAESCLVGVIATRSSADDIAALFLEELGAGSAVVAEVCISTG